MSVYSIEFERVQVSLADAIRLRLSFGEPASNDVIVREVEATMGTLKSGGLKGGKIVLLDGAASLPVIATIVHHVSHLFETVAIYDPKLKGYVIAIVHGPAFKVGDIINACDVKEVSDDQ
jgi:CRISPR-associated protein Csx3